MITFGRFGDCFQDGIELHGEFMLWSKAMNRLALNIPPPTMGRVAAGVFPPQKYHGFRIPTLAVKRRCLTSIFFDFQRLNGAVRTNNKVYRIHVFLCLLYIYVYILMITYTYYIYYIYSNIQFIHVQRFFYKCIKGTFRRLFPTTNI